jgi:hypothetical protein
MAVYVLSLKIKVKIIKVKFFKVKFIFRRKASPSIDKFGAKPLIFSQRQNQRQRQHTGLLHRFAPRNDGILTRHRERSEAIQYFKAVDVDFAFDFD